MYTCMNCHGVMVGRDIKLLSERDALKRVYGLNCSNCGSAYILEIKQINGPTISREALEEIKNPEGKNARRSKAITVQAAPHRLEP